MYFLFGSYTWVGKKTSRKSGFQKAEVVNYSDVSYTFQKLQENIDKCQFRQTF